MNVDRIETAQALDDLLMDLNDAGHEPVIPVLDARGVPALAWLKEVGGDDVQPGVTIGGPDLPNVSSLDRDQSTGWLRYPVTVLRRPDAGAQVTREQVDKAITDAAQTADRTRALTDILAEAVLGLVGVTIVDGTDGGHARVRPTLTPDAAPPAARSVAPVVWGWVDDVTWCEYCEGEPTTSFVHVCADEATARAAVNLDREARVLIRGEGISVMEARDRG